ncbi:MAG: HepT-like ribonuclease domain-containing protein [Pseudomonadota bacterium]|jgi:uncharacterized protein with HEPN domain
MPDIDTIHLAEMLRSAQLIRTFVRSVQRDSLQYDLMRRVSVFARIIGMSFSAKRISRRFRSGHPGIPWDPIIQLGDDLIRKPETVDFDQVWRFAKILVPELILKAAVLVPRSVREQ